MSSLFRDEAVAHQHRVPEGQPLEAGVPGWRWILALVAGAALAAVAVLALMRFDERLRAEGVVEPRGGMLVVPAPMDGTVLALAIEAGEQVAAGTLLLQLAGAVLEPELAQSREQRVATLEREIADLRLLQDSRTRSSEATRGMLQTQRARLRESQQQVEVEIELQARRVALAEQELPEMRALGARGLISAIQVRAAESQALELRMQSARLERERTAQLHESERIDREIAELGDRGRADGIELQQRIAALQEERAQLARSGQIGVHAPLAGQVATLLVLPGQSVVRGEPLLALASQADDLVVSLRIPAGSPARIDVGAPVVMRSPAFPAARYGYLHGEVLTVSGATVAASHTRAGGPWPGGDEAAFDVRVDLEPAPAGIRLRPGMRVDADIILQRRRVLDLLLEPLSEKAELWR